MAWFTLFVPRVRAMPRVTATPCPAVVRSSATWPAKSWPYGPCPCRAARPIARPIPTLCPRRPPRRRSRSSIRSATNGPNSPPPTRRDLLPPRRGVLCQTRPTIPIKDLAMAVWRTSVWPRSAALTLEDWSRQVRRLSSSQVHRQPDSTPSYGGPIGKSCSHSWDTPKRRSRCEAASSEGRPDHAGWDVSVKT